MSDIHADMLERWNRTASGTGYTITGSDELEYEVWQAKGGKWNALRHNDENSRTLLSTLEPTRFAAMARCEAAMLEA